MLEGKGRSGMDIATDAGKEILINLVLHKIGGGGGPRAAAELELAAEKAAKAAGGAIKQEIVRTEGPAVVSAVERGDGRLVKDAALKDEGYVFEVEIHHEGGVHTYRRTKGGKWCRWSTYS